ncbi:STAS domain-containing protein [Rhodococcus erythropolis]|uniref:STAS domain-containing protein n=1 Tax=Rhodococcus erythropolis TaxID=1833 RepID=UPI003792CFC6
MNTPPPDPTERQLANSSRRAAPLSGRRRTGYDTPHSARAPEDTHTHAAAAVSVAFTAIPAAHDIVRYCVSGAIDATTCGTFGIHLDEITAAGGPFVLDLTGVPFVSVGGLTLIETLAHATARLDIRWALTAQRSLHRFLTLLNMDTRIPSFDSNEAAVAHLTNALGHCHPSR